ncbi:regulator sip5 [Fusarium longipes]|uniref:Regulator sip5 n=1 Tax=Fusarium longipes TaxID=694270 RepID=A0A395T5H6_9HYPO|nr:regulator sip5 [Fusarium longipes]
MGNSNTKESRTEGDASRRYSTPVDPSIRDHLREQRQDNRASRRISRAEINIFGLGPSSSRNNREQQDAPFERRETKQEREARRLERERVLRAKERERSMREEHVDGGYLVTLGTYTGTEDFSKPVVRQLQIERKLAPFWRGLNDWSSSWAEHQLVAAARGLPIPPADAPPDPELIPQPLPASENNLQNLTVPMGPRTLSAASDRSGSNTGSALPSPSTTGQGKTPFKPRAKALAAALSGSSRNASSTDLTPKEVALPNDPFVNGQPLEVFLYKDADECPICFLTYPPYLNRTRCCDQPICSECFVQIKRADPHLPEHHPNGEARDPNEGLNADDPPEMLISEPSACPYCQQPEFGVTYDPPPFRRGLVYSGNHSHSTAMSSQTSLNSTLQTPPAPGRRRAHSLSANAPNVITTDRVRPDWAAKLASARNHQARRAAAATALHTAAFLMGGNEQRTILRAPRLGRRNTRNADTEGNAAGSSGQAQTQEGAQDEGPEPGARGSSRNGTGRRSRMDELEDMMFMEAVRLSLASEEERKRKEEKAIRKETKRREKEERKAAKKGGNPYSGSASGASASSLSLGGLGRRRGNSTASNLRVEATMSRASQASSTPESPAEPKTKDDSTGKGKGVDRSTPDSQAGPASSSSSLPLPSGPSRGGSHLRQMSNASSAGSSVNDSPVGTYTGPDYLGADEGPRSSGLSLGAYSDDGERDAGSAGSEPMFNFSSLAQMVGADLESGSMRRDEDGESHEGTGYTRPLSQVKEDDKEDAEAEHVEGTPAQIEVVPSSGLATPAVMVTPETPAPADEAEHEDKQLGHSQTYRSATEQKGI